MRDAPSNLPSSAVSPAAATAALTRVAERLAELAGALGHADIAEAIRDDAKRRLDDGRVRVVVLGEIKHGKSTLINALLGAALLPVGVTPTTGAVVAVRVDPDAARPAPESDDAGDEPSDEPSPGLARTGTFLLDRHGHRSPLERDRFEQLARGKDHDEAGRTPELLVDADQLPATLELIDTPGFNDIDRFRAAVSRSELPRADVLVLVLDATQVLSRSELGLIREAIAAVGGLDDSGARCLLVINRIDLVPEDERPRIVEHIRHELATILPGPLDPYLTDSKTALRAPETNTEPVIAVSLLRDALFGLAGRGREILPARARTALLRHAKLLGYNEAIQARALRLEQAEIAKEIAAVDAAMAARVEDLASLRKTIVDAGERILAAAHERLAGFRAELEQSAKGQIHKADIQTLTQVVPGAIQDAFLDFVNHEGERLRLELEQLTRDLLATHGELAHRRLVEATMPLGFCGPGLYVEPPAVLIEIGMLALGLVGTIIWYFGNTMTGMIMTVASPLTTVILREKTVRDARAQANEVLPGALDRAVDQLRATVDEVVRRHGDALDEHLLLADRALAAQLHDTLSSAERRLDAHEARLAAAIAAAQPRPPVDADPAAPSWDADATLAAPKADADPADAEPDAPAVDPASSTPSPEAAPEPTAAERLRARVHTAARAELDGLEQQLAELTATLVAIPVGERMQTAADHDDDDDDDDDDEPPPILH